MSCQDYDLSTHLWVLLMATAGLSKDLVYLVASIAPCELRSQLGFESCLPSPLQVASPSRLPLSLPLQWRLEIMSGMMVCCLGSLPRLGQNTKPSAISICKLFPRMGFQRSSRANKVLRDCNLEGLNTGHRNRHEGLLGEPRTLISHRAAQGKSR